VGLIHLYWVLKCGLAVGLMTCRVGRRVGRVIARSFLRRSPPPFPGISLSKSSLSLSPCRLFPGHSAELPFQIFENGGNDKLQPDKTYELEGILVWSK